MIRASLKWLTMTAASLATLLLAACGPDMADLRQYVEEVKNRKNAQVEPIPQMKQYEAFSYQEGGRRDPFVPTIPQRDSNTANSGLRPDENRNKEPLEEFPIDSLRMVGVVNYEGKQYAMVKAPDSVIHRVTVGDHLGQNYGKITKISESETDLVEIVADGFGGFTERPATLTTAQ
jgi:type IV pilus assembly protein PilP